MQLVNLNGNLECQGEFLPDLCPKIKMTHALWRIIIITVSSYGNDRELGAKTPSLNTSQIE